MTDPSTHHDAPPRNAATLAAWLDRAANATGVAAGRLRRQLGFMVLAAMLETERTRWGIGPQSVGSGSSLGTRAAK